MTNRFRTLAAADRRRRSRWLALLAGIVLLVFAMNAVAQAPAAPGGAAPPPAAEEIDNLVGPIALYPDDLVAIILPASTNPLQLVQADRFLDKRKADPKLPVDDKWDDAVKSLLNYPDVVKKMSADLDWTSALGEAVVADQGAVLEAIQSFRRRAQAAGNLKSDGKQVVQVEKEIISIVPADPQVIYVPQYNPTTVVSYGPAPVYGYYPTPYPSYYYPYAPGAALAAGVIWGAAIGAAWGGNHYGATTAGTPTSTSTATPTSTLATSTAAAARAQQPAGGGTRMEVQQAARPGQQLRWQDRPVARVRAMRAQAQAAAFEGGGAGAARRRNLRAVRPVGAAREAATPWAAPARGGKRRWTVHVALRAAARGPAQARGRQRVGAERGASRSAPSGGGARRRRWRWRWRWRWWRRWRSRRRWPSLKAGAWSCAHSLQSKARHQLMNITRFWSFLRRLALALMVAVPLAAAAAPQETFATPEAAVDALMAALKADSDAAMVAIFGEEHKDLVIQSDRAAVQRHPGEDFRGHADAARAAGAEPGPPRAVIGDEAWPVPIPIVRAGDRWRFASEEGEDEIVNRRIGGNERNAIYVLHAYIDAQRAYAARDRDGDGVLQYAQKLASTPGKHDGLYWPADTAKGEEASPFGPLIAESAAYLKGHAAGDPYRGYHFRILTRQGKNAPGGAYNYVINGRMIAGFAMVAYPAEYGRSGVMTFIVSHNGKVYEKDLGRNSVQIGAKMATFDPGAGWKQTAH